MSKKVPKTIRTREFHLIYQISGNLDILDKSGDTIHSIMLINDGIRYVMTNSSKEWITANRKPSPIRKYISIIIWNYPNY